MRRGAKSCEQGFYQHLIQAIQSEKIWNAMVGSHPSLNATLMRCQMARSMNNRRPHTGLRSHRKPSC